MTNWLTEGLADCLSSEVTGCWYKNTAQPKFNLQWEEAPVWQSAVRQGSHQVILSAYPFSVCVWKMRARVCVRTCHHSPTGSSYTQALRVSPRWHQYARHRHTHNWCYTSNKSQAPTDVYNSPAQKSAFVSIFNRDWSKCKCNVNVITNKHKRREIEHLMYSQSHNLQMRLYQTPFIIWVILDTTSIQNIYIVLLREKGNTLSFQCKYQQDPRHKQTSITLWSDCTRLHSEFKQL